ncbi:SigE family RNA polymerase sigma factor [Actinospica robiniae]|uniref:SigE family RNA polymerase sigma factor n=1 Tax=Actinospica robiniae TaxID=304901 RepID=UPI00040BEFB2|nr:SigE family RNA polymerase sigma factor [Actinospica robiniae]
MDRASEQRYCDFVLSRRAGLLREAYLLVGDVHLAEDLVQTVLAKIYVAWHRVSASDAPDAYVRKMLINTNVSRHRRRRVAEVLTDAPPDAADLASAQSHAPSSAVIEALMGLSRRQRTAIVLRFWDDLPESAVAELMGCSVGSVRTHTARAMARLRAVPDLRQPAAHER